MKQIYCDGVENIKKNKKKIEELFKIKIEIKEKEVFINGSSEDEYDAEKMIDALNFGFTFSKAALIKKRDFIFEILNIKDYTRRRDFKTIRARIIGKKGKALKTLSELTDCYFEIKDNHVGILGSPESIENAQNAVISIVRGAKHSNVYSFLEKHQPKEVFDLGLKEKNRDNKL